MRLGVYNEAKKSEPVLYLALEKTGDNGIRLIAVDDHGNWIQSLLNLDGSGVIARAYLNYDFIKDYGLSVDASNRLQVN